MDLIDRQAAIERIQATGYADQIKDNLIFILRLLPSVPTVQPDFYLTEKIDKAYDDGYEAGYLQARHDWGNEDGTD